MFQERHTVCVAGIYLLMGMRSERKLEGRQSPCQVGCRVLCAAVTEFDVILTVVKTHWRF